MDPVISTQNIEKRLTLVTYTAHEMTVMGEKRLPLKVVIVRFDGTFRSQFGVWVNLIKLILNLM